MEEAQAFDVGDFTALLEDVDAYRSEMLTFLQSYDVILCPVCAFPAPPHGTTMEPEMRRGFSYTGAYNLTGWPGAVVRGGTAPDGLPIGVQVVAYNKGLDSIQLYGPTIFSEVRTISVVSIVVVAHKDSFVVTCSCENKV